MGLQTWINVMAHISLSLPLPFCPVFYSLRYLNIFMFPLLLIFISAKFLLIFPRTYIQAINKSFCWPANSPLHCPSYWILQTRLTGTLASIYPQQPQLYFKAKQNTPTLLQWSCSVTACRFCVSQAHLLHDSYVFSLEDLLRSLA